MMLQREVKPWIAGRANIKQSRNCLGALTRITAAPLSYDSVFKPA